MHKIYLSKSSLPFVSLSLTHMAVQWCKLEMWNIWSVPFCLIFATTTKPKEVGKCAQKKNLKKTCINNITWTTTNYFLYRSSYTHTHWRIQVHISCHKKTPMKNIKNIYLAYRSHFICFAAGFNHFVRGFQKEHSISLQCFIRILNRKCGNSGTCNAAIHPLL